MGEQKSSSSNSRWNWEVAGFEPRKSSASATSSPRSASVDFDDYNPGAPLVRRYSISATSVLPHSELSKQAVASKLKMLKDKVKVIGAWISEFGISVLKILDFGFFILLELISDGEK